MAERVLPALRTLREQLADKPEHAEGAAALDTLLGDADAAAEARAMLAAANEALIESDTTTLDAPHVVLEPQRAAARVYNDAARAFADANAALQAILRGESCARSS